MCKCRTDGSTFTLSPQIKTGEPSFVPGSRWILQVQPLNKNELQTSNIQVHVPEERNKVVDTFSFCVSGTEILSIREKTRSSTVASWKQHQFKPPSKRMKAGSLKKTGLMSPAGSLRFTQAPYNKAHNDDRPPQVLEEGRTSIKGARTSRTVSMKQGGRTRWDGALDLQCSDQEQTSPH